jgi:sensor histidine kinase YesM
MIMSWREFIFSNRRPVRLSRHIVFWTTWWLYFFLTRYFYPNALLPGHAAIEKIKKDNINKTFRHFGDYLDGVYVWNMTELIRSFLMLSIHIAACYIVIYVLMPRLLLKAKYVLMLIGIVLLMGAMVMASRFMDTSILPLLTDQDGKPQIPFYGSVFSGVINAIKVIALAAAIKFGKYWWQKLKEKEKLERERINTELQLLKAQIRPGFLFHSLNNIYAFALAGSPRAPELLLKLSGLLSYMLYECDESFVPLEKEVEMMKDYLELEKIRLDESVDMELTISGDMENKMIAPFILLPFIENSFKQTTGPSEQNWINMEINIEHNCFSMILVNGVMPETADLNEHFTNNLINVQKRLALLYPQKHELKISREPDVLIVHLKIQLINLPNIIPAGHEKLTSPVPGSEQLTSHAATK